MSCQLFGFKISCSASDFNVFQLFICMELAKWQIFKFHYLRCVLIAKTDRIELKNEWMEQKKRFVFLFFFNILFSKWYTTSCIRHTDHYFKNKNINNNNNCACTHFCKNYNKKKTLLFAFVGFLLYFVSSSTFFFILIFIVFFSFSLLFRMSVPIYISFFCRVRSCYLHFIFYFFALFIAHTCFASKPVGKERKSFSWVIHKHLFDIIICFLLLLFYCSYFLRFHLLLFSRFWCMVMFYAFDFIPINCSDSNIELCIYLILIIFLF